VTVQFQFLEIRLAASQRHYE